jgi:hypothetical protein
MDDEKIYPPTYGYIYKLLNPLNNFCYIGSTTYSYPKKRYNHHISKWGTTRQTYPELFEGVENPEWIILHKYKYKIREDLRKLENEYINIYKTHSSVNIVNKYNAYMSEEDHKELIKKAKRKYGKTEKGLLAKKWSKYRCKMRKLLLREIHDNISVIN